MAESLYHHLRHQLCLHCRPLLLGLHPQFPRRVNTHAQNYHPVVRKRLGSCFIICRLLLIFRFVLDISMIVTFLIYLYKFAVLKVEKLVKNGKGLSFLHKFVRLTLSHSTPLIGDNLHTSCGALRVSGSGSSVLFRSLDPGAAVPHGPGNCLHGALPADRVLRDRLPRRHGPPLPHLLPGTARTQDEPSRTKSQRGKHQRAIQVQRT